MATDAAWSNTPQTNIRLVGPRKYPKDKQTPDTVSWRYKCRCHARPRAGHGHPVHPQSEVLSGCRRQATSIALAVAAGSSHRFASQNGFRTTARRSGPVARNKFLLSKRTSQSRENRRGSGHSSWELRESTRPSFAPADLRGVCVDHLLPTS